MSGAPHYERFFRTSGDLLCVLDSEGRFLHANEAFRDVLGYPESVLLGEGFVRVVHEDAAAEVRAFFEKSEGDGSLRMTARFLHRDLTYRRLSWSLRRVAEDAAIYGAGREVLEEGIDPERRRGDATLIKMQATAMVGGWEFDRQKNELYWTDETYRIHEVAPEYSPTVEEGINFYAPEFVPTISAAFAACVNEGRSYQLELQILTAKGRRLWVRATAQPMLEDGEVVRVIGAFQDIDSFKRREIELEEKLAIIHEQRSAIRALSAPIIQVWDRVLALPVVGTLNEERAEEITARLLDAVAANAARYAILDLTGVETVDEGTANHLVKIIRAIQLLGAKSIVTGIRPAMAQTLVAHGAGFGSAQTVSNLREAIKISMRDATVARTS
ncbi:MAG: PAS domain-containing protein [Byssovorax sp.]